VFPRVILYAYNATLGVNMARLVVVAVVLVVGLLSVVGFAATPLWVPDNTSWAFMVEDDGLLAPDSGPVKVAPAFYDSHQLRLLKRRELYCRFLGIQGQHEEIRRQLRRCVVYG